MTTKPKPTQTPPTQSPPSSDGDQKAPAQTAPANNSSAQKDRPIRSVKIGSVQVAIWRNLTAEGRVVFNATLERLYFDEKAEKWESSQSFGRRDMLELSKAVDIAHTVMCEQHEHANRRTGARPVSNPAGNTR